MNKGYKEMEYQATRKIEVLMQGKYKNYQFYILNLGTHPTAYVEIPKTHKFYMEDYNSIDCDLNVNGGLTYSDEKLYLNNNEEINGWFIGWDYAHLGDYCGYDNMWRTMLGDNGGDKKWTTLEIFEEVKSCIDTLDKEVKE